MSENHDPQSFSMDEVERTGILGESEAWCSPSLPRSGTLGPVVEEAVETYPVAVAWPDWTWGNPLVHLSC